MPENPRFLLGYGERLTAAVAPPPRGGGGDLAYTLDEAVRRLAPMAAATSTDLNNLPSDACPNDEAVAVVTLHPQSLAKSYYPQRLFDQFSLRQVGSRPVNVRPEKWTRQGEPEPCPSNDLFIAGPRQSFTQWAQVLDAAQPAITDQIRRIESIRAPQVAERLRGLPSGISIDESGDSVLIEVVLHASADPSADYIVFAFEEYADSLGASPSLDRRLYAGGLCFIPVEAPAGAIPLLAQFSFLRVARPMPGFRKIMPVERAIPDPTAAPCPLPANPSVNPDLRVAVFDGGLEEGSALSPWANSYEAEDVGSGSPVTYNHGHAVTSALLFGPLIPGESAPQPYAMVDHYRVIDEKSNEDPYELYDVLRRIDSILSQRRYEFFNLSLGPSLSIEDDEVHSWTALLDEHLSDGHAMASIAVGNNGTDNRALGLARIQVPADCVNALAVGAADSSRADWRRARYSALGPGRAPGRVKPDLLYFGGDQREPFFVYDPDNAPRVATTCGTSFAAPAALRLALGVRAHFGERISPLGLKALLIHSAEANKQAKEEVGWGRLPEDLNELVLCPDGTVRVIYQGELTPSQYLRALIPVPDETLQGMVDIAATFCYACPTDPADPGSYTRSGLDVTFRPNATKFKEGSIEPVPKPFFRRSEFDNEQTLRRDAHKWETTLHANKRLRGASLNRPVFDIHYNARSSGGPARHAEKIRYALVVTIASTKTADLYDRVLVKYAGQLEVLRPLVEIPVQVDKLPG